MTNKKIISAKLLINNLKWCKSRCNNIMAMVKADAYGHGLKEIVNIIKNDVKFFGVNNSTEALKLARLLDNSHIVLVVSKSNSFTNLIKHNIHITVDSVKELQKILNVSKKLNICANIHIAVNTGMNRIGVKSLKEFNEMLALVSANRGLKLCGVFTHFYNADSEGSAVNDQLRVFNRYVKRINSKDVIIHVGGGFALCHNLPKYVDMVRVGYFLYGYGNKSLKPVMTIKSKIIKITNCKQGENIGYGVSRISSNKKIALIPFGYADGLVRGLSNQAHVTIGGQNCKIIGRICMDAFMVDLMGAEAKVGDDVIIFNDADYFSSLIGTSPYEILTNFSKARARPIIIDRK